MRARGRFAFWARMGAPDRLLVFFEGGGGCWDYRSCAPGSTFFDDDVDASDDPSLGGGVLDLDDPRNPFRGWSVLFVPSCTGDVYAGDAVRTYRAGGASVTVHHRGHANATAALDWVFRRVPDPRRVFVTGCSAGSIGSILHAPRILRQYPRAQVAQLGDSLGYLFSRPTDLRELWGADRVLPGLGAGRAGDPAGPLHHAAVLPGGRRPLPAGVVRPGQLRRRRRPAPLPRGRRGRPGRVRAALGGNLAAIRATSPNFRSCLLEGSAHCALPRPEFYTLTSGGVGLRDWVAALAEGARCPTSRRATRPGGGPLRTRRGRSAPPSSAPGLGQGGQLLQVAPGQLDPDGGQVGLELGGGDGPGQDDVGPGVGEHGGQRDRVHPDAVAGRDPPEDGRRPGRGRAG